jgi:hypothetical protein
MEDTIKNNSHTKTRQGSFLTRTSMPHSLTFCTPAALVPESLSVASSRDPNLEYQIDSRSEMMKNVI